MAHLLDRQLRFDNEIALSHRPQQHSTVFTICTIRTIFAVFLLASIVHIPACHSSGVLASAASYRGRDLFRAIAPTLPTGPRNCCVSTPVPRYDNPCSHERVDHQIPDLHEHDTPTFLPWFKGSRPGALWESAKYPDACRRNAVCRLFGASLLLVNDIHVTGRHLCLFLSLPLRPPSCLHAHYSAFSDSILHASADDNFGISTISYTCPTLTGLSRGCVSPCSAEPSLESTVQCLVGFKSWRKAWARTRKDPTAFVFKLSSARQVNKLVCPPVFNLNFTCASTSLRFFFQS